jgi:hypothetical protein
MSQKQRTNISYPTQSATNHSFPLMSRRTLFTTRWSLDIHFLMTNRARTNVTFHAIIGPHLSTPNLPSISPLQKNLINKSNQTTKAFPPYEDPSTNGIGWFSPFFPTVATGTKIHHLH